VNSLLDLLAHPHVAETGAVVWLEQPGVGKVPIPQGASLPRLGHDDARATAPGLDQHRAEIFRGVGSTG
jgi:crotonobetainyl-CoA:carnitine CoA-transferase CaiB-like acyl-CoA transferase